MSRVLNFSAGPTTMPEELLPQSAGDMLDWRGAKCACWPICNALPVAGLDALVE
jgi:phosphoserine aminotransferase